MRNRLEIAGELLISSGVIFISIGDKEVHYLKVLADEIFNRDNFLNTITRISKTASNKGNHFTPSTDYLLCYAKNKSELGQFKDKIDESLYKKIETSGKRKGEKYRDDIAYYQSGLHIIAPNQRYYVKCPDGALVIPPGETFPDIKKEGVPVKKSTGNDKYWRWSLETFNKNQELLVFKKTKTSPLVDSYGKQAEWNIYTKSYLKDRMEKGNKPKTFFDKFINRKGADYLKKIGINFNYSKPVELIKYLIDIVGTDKNDIILDFFAGSSTTAEAVIRVNKEDDGERNYIICEQMDYIDTATVPRTKKVTGELLRATITKSVQSLGLNKRNLIRKWKS